MDVREKNGKTAGREVQVRTPGEKQVRQRERGEATLRQNLAVKKFPPKWAELRCEMKIACGRGMGVIREGLRYENGKRNFEMGVA